METVAAFPALEFCPWRANSNYRTILKWNRDKKIDVPVNSLQGDCRKCFVLVKKKKKLIKKINMTPDKLLESNLTLQMAPLCSFWGGRTKQWGINNDFNLIWTCVRQHVSPAAVPGAGCHLPFVFLYICSSPEGSALLWFGSCHVQKPRIDMNSFIINPKTYRSAQKGSLDSSSLPKILPRSSFHSLHCSSRGFWHATLIDLD